MVSIFDISIEEQSRAKLFKFLSLRLPLIIRKSEDEGLKKIALYIKKSTLEFIEGGGENWPPRSDFAETYGSQGGRNNITFRKKTRRDLDNGILFIMRYFRWRIFNDDENKNLFIDFRKSSRDEVNALIKMIQKGKTITVTDLMRKAFSYTDFPLEATTTQIDIPAREIGKPVFRKTSNDYFVKLTDGFYPEFRKLIGVN